MSFEEEFDKIIRRKAEEVEYPFDQNSWDKANSLLDAERKEARMLKFKRFYLPTIVAAVMGTSGFIAYNYLNTDSTSNEVAVSQNINTKTNSALPLIIESELKPLAEENKVLQKTKNLTVINSDKNQKYETEDQKKRLIISDKAKINNAVEIEKTKEIPLVETKSSPELEKNNFEKELVKKSTKTNGAAIVSDVERSSSKSQPQNKDEAQIIKESISSTNKNDVLTKQNDSEKFAESIPSNITEPSLDSKNESSMEAEDYVVTVEHLKAVHSLIPLTIEEGDLMASDFIYLNRYDDDYYKNNSTPKKHYLNVELGANYLLGWDAQAGKDAQGFNWFAGFNYGRYLSKKFDISFGIQAYNIANIKQPFYLISEKEYGFGSKNIYTRVTSNELFYMAVPLVFNYSFNSTNKIGLGINAAYLIGAKNTVSKYYLLDNEEKSISEKASNNNGIYQGTSMTNLMLSVQYKTQLTKRIGLNLEFNYGLTDIFENIGTIKTTESPMGIRLGLNYTLFDK